MNIVVTKPDIPNDMAEIQEVLFHTWLSTYPNTQIGITEEDINVMFKERHSPESIAKRIAAHTNRSPNDYFFVAKILPEKTIIGICRIVIREEYNQLQAIYVLPEYQGRGVGRMFWKKALQCFDKNKKVVVHVATYNSKAITFYKKIGFVDNGKRFTEERHRMPMSGVLIPEMEMERKVDIIC
jgi:ribosomal protein S18 acetylase RimI-like enzyme